MDYMSKPFIFECLAHHGIKGQKWGVRRTPEQLGHLKNEYRSKATTASDHYQRAIKGVYNSREAANKRERRHFEGIAANQYDKALNYEKQMHKIQRRLERRGVEIQRSPKQAELYREAAQWLRDIGFQAVAVQPYSFASRNFCGPFEWLRYGKPLDFIGAHTSFLPPADNCMAKRKPPLRLHSGGWSWCSVLGQDQDSS